MIPSLSITFEDCYVTKSSTMGVKVHGKEKVAIKLLWKKYYKISTGRYIKAYEEKIYTQFLEAEGQQIFVHFEEESQNTYSGKKCLWLNIFC